MGAMSPMGAILRMVTVGTPHSTDIQYTSGLGLVGSECWNYCWKTNTLRDFQKNCSGGHTHPKRRVLVQLPNMHPTAGAYLNLPTPRL